MNFLLRTIAVAVAVAVAAFLVPGIAVTGNSLADKGIALLGVALIIGVLNAVVKPIMQGLTGCLIMVTFGLFLLVINALILMLTSWIAGQIGIGFRVDGFVPAVLGSIVISIVSGLMSGILGTSKE